MVTRIQNRNNGYSEGLFSQNTKIENTTFNSIDGATALKLDEKFEINEQEQNSLINNIEPNIHEPEKEVNPKDVDSIPAGVSIESASYMENNNENSLIKDSEEKTLDDNINSNIVVETTGSFYQYAKDCELLICIDMSTAILDAMLLKKPIISVLIADKDSPSTIFQKNYVLKTTIENFEKTLIHSLDDKFKIFCIAQGEKFIHDYILNHGTSAKSLLNFLSNMFTKTTN